jgi:hypothetical protein
MIEEAIYAHLIADSVVSPLVAVGGGKYHIYPARLPDGFPTTASYAIAYTEIKQQLVYPVLRESVFQFSCFGRTYAQAKALANALDNALNDYNESKLGGVLAVNYVKFQNRSHLYDEVGKLWYYVVDVSFKY